MEEGVRLLLNVHVAKVDWWENLDKKERENEKTLSAKKKEKKEEKSDQSHSSFVRSRASRRQDGKRAGDGDAKGLLQDRKQRSRDLLGCLLTHLHRLVRRRRHLVPRRPRTHQQRVVVERFFFDHRRC